MITRMEILYLSKVPCYKKPAIFSTGGYSVKIDGLEFNFDFEDMIANAEIKDGYLYIHSLQKNLDETILDKITPDEADGLLRKVKKEDFKEVFYECDSDINGDDPILLEPVTITFYDYSTTGDGTPITVKGERFSNLEL